VNSVIHIGANKTASTLFQRRLFAKHPAIAYIGEDCFGYEVLREDLDKLLHEDESVYDEKKMIKLFEQSKKENKTFLFSSEDIMGTRHPTQTAKRLKTLLPNAQIVMVMRNQMTTFPSWYVNHGSFLKLVPKSYWKKYVSFEDWLEYCFNFPYTTPLEAMNYEKYYAIFKEVFGVENIHVFLYEEFLENRETFYEKWAEVLDIPADDISKYLDGHQERSSLSVFDFKIHKMSKFSPLLSRVAKKSLKKVLDNKRSLKLTIPSSYEKRVFNYYASGNSALKKELGLELEKYNYPLEEK